MKAKQSHKHKHMISLCEDERAAEIVLKCNVTEKVTHLDQRHRSDPTL